MRIKIKCPNKECRKTLVVDTDMAGKKGKCSTCDAVFVIPGKPGSKSKSSSGTGGDSVDLSGSQSNELDEEQRKSAESEARRSSQSRRSRSKPRRQTDDYEDYEDDYEEERPRSKSRSGSRRSRPQPRDDYEDDYADDYEEDYGDDYGEDYGDDYEDDYDAPRSRRGRRGDDFGGSRGAAPRPSGRRPSRRGRGPNLKLPSVGLLIMAIAGCVFAGALGVKIITELIAMLKHPAPLIFLTPLGPSNTMATFWKIAELIGMGAAVAVIVGYAFLILIPNMHNSKGLTIAALSLGGINLIIQLVFKVIPLYGNGSNLFGVSGRGLIGGNGDSIILEILMKIGLMEALFIAELVLVALAIMAINRQFRDRYNFDAAKTLIIPAGVYGGIYVVMGVFVLILKDEKNMGETGATIWKWVFYLLRLGCQGMLLWYYISYTFTMFNTRNSVPES